jgi:hypothetical protein
LPELPAGQNAILVQNSANIAFNHARGIIAGSGIFPSTKKMKKSSHESLAFMPN